MNVHQVQGLPPPKSVFVICSSFRSCVCVRSEACPRRRGYAGIAGAPPGRHAEVAARASSVLPEKAAAGPPGFLCARAAAVPFAGTAGTQPVAKGRATARAPGLPGRGAARAPGRWAVGIPLKAAAGAVGILPLRALGCNAAGVAPGRVCTGSAADARCAKVFVLAPGVLCADAAGKLCALAANAVGAPPAMAWADADCRTSGALALLAVASGIAPLQVAAADAVGALPVRVSTAAACARPGGADSASEMQLEELLWLPRRAETLSNSSIAAFLQ